MNQGDGATVGVADKKVIANAGLPNDLWQHHQSLVVHEIDLSRQRAGGGAPISPAAVDQCPVTGDFDQSGREIPPQGHASQPFVKKYQGGRFIRRGTHPCDLQPAPVNT